MDYVTILRVDREIPISDLIRSLYRYLDGASHITDDPFMRHHHDVWLNYRVLP